MPYLLSAANMTARRKCGYVNFLMKEVNQETGAKDTKKEDASKPFRLEASFFNILCLLRRAETRIPWPRGWSVRSRNPCLPEKSSRQLRM